MIDHVGRKRIAGSPSPQDSQYTRTPPRSTKPTASGSRARVCSRLAAPALAVANVPAGTFALALPIWLSPLERLDPSIDPGQQGLVPLADPGKALEHVAERKGHRQCRHCLHLQLVLHSVLADRPGEGLAQDLAPLGLDGHDARAQVPPVPGQRLELEPDLLVAPPQDL